MTEHPIEVPSAHLIDLAGGTALVERVLPQRLEEVVSTRCVVELHEALVDEPTDEIEDGVALQIGAGGKLLDRVEVEGADEAGEAAEQQPFVRREQVVAPLQRREQRLLTSRRGA